MEEQFNKIKGFFTESPEYIYLIVTLVFLILLIGAVKKKTWAIDPDSGFLRIIYQTFGEKFFRVYVIIIYFLGMISGFVGSWIYFSK